MNGPPHTVSVVFTSVLNDTLPPLAVIPDSIRNLLHRQRTTSPVVVSRHRQQSERLPLGIAPASLRVIARHEAIQTKSERRRPVALALGQPPQAADENGTLELLTVPSP